MTSAAATPRRCDILVRNAHLVTMDDGRRVFGDGAVAIEGNKIVDVGQGKELSAAFEPERTIDARGGTVHPGYIDSHMHVSYLIFRWAFRDTTHWPEYVACHARYWEVVEDEEEYHSSRLACLEMARNGVTCYLDSGSVVEPDAAARATVEVGIRGLLADPFLADLQPAGGPEIKRVPQTTKRALSLLGTELKRNDDPDALVQGHVALRGLASSTDELQLAAKAVADQAGVVLNQHQSFNEFDVRDDDERFGKHAMVHFHEIGALGPNCTWSHMNIIREDEVSAVIDSGMTPVWNPSASMYLGVGANFRGRHSELHHAGVPMALACDSANSSGRFDLADQGYLAVISAREKTGSLALHPEDALDMMTRNGARAVGMADRIGSIEVGKQADLVIHHNDVPEAHPGLDRIRQLVFSTRASSVAHVVVDGKVIVENGRSTMVDEAEVYARADEAARRVMHRLGAKADDRWPVI